MVIGSQVIALMIEPTMTGKARWQSINVLHKV